MESTELRDQYLSFFGSKQHAVISSASLIPDNDPSVLFTTSGMHPLVPYLLGEQHPEGNRLTGVQKCVRTQDIDEVGNNRHHTFFEMLGNWSLGDYFKKEAITWSLEFLTSREWLGLDKDRLAVSVFAGDEDAPFDEESYDTWLSLGIPKERIARLPKKNNWWGMQTGPCGPDTEIFYWTGNSDKIPKSFNDDHPSWVEIWNNVFMQFNRREDGDLTPLPRQNVDTGMGLERILTVINGFDDDYKTDVFANLIRTIEELSSQRYGASDEVKKSMRVIADHVRAATMIMSDDRRFKPGNVEHGYVIRRLIRRAIRHGRLLGIKSNFCTSVSNTVVDGLKAVYPELSRNKDAVLSELGKEEDLFRKTLEKGIREFEKLLREIQESPRETVGRANVIPGERAFKLYETYGFPLEMIQELAAENCLTVDEEGFKQALEAHQKKSRLGAEQKFRGGLADNSEMVTKLHTATHLLHQALRTVLGSRVQQKGSNISSERLRFDFTHDEKITAKQITQVQNLVNEQIQKALSVTCEEMSVEEAKKSGALGFFEHKYGEKVKVYTVGGDPADYFSKEICGGPHVSSTKNLGTFRIVKEEASSAGVRRIKAILE